MKRAIGMGIALLLLLALASCGERGDALEPSETNPATETTNEPITLNKPVLSEEEWNILEDALTGPHHIPDSLSFASLGDFLNAYKTARKGGDITKFVSGWGEGYGENTLADIVESVAFAALEKIYVPSNIPAPYRFRGITVDKECVRVQYVREEHLGSIVDAQSMVDAQLDKFVYYFSRLDRDPTMDEILLANHLTRKDLIDDMYLFSGTHSLRWVLDGRDMSLYLPYPPVVLMKEISIVEYLGLNSVEELVQFTAFEVLEL